MNYFQSPTLGNYHLFRHYDHLITFPLPSYRFIAQLGVGLTYIFAIRLIGHAAYIFT